MHKLIKTKRWLPILLAVGVAGIAALCLILERASRFEVSRLEPKPGPCLADRHGRLLRLAPGPSGMRCLLLPGGDVPPLLAAAFIAAEDQRFASHPGVDARAVLRAVVQNVRAGRIVSGASTITQQLARLAYPGQRGFAGKIVEMARALRIERALSKPEIMRRYLDMAPMGHDLAGVETAAQSYFSLPAARLDAAQAALLAALVKAPGRLAPDRGDGKELARRRDMILKRMGGAGALSPEELKLAMASPIPRARLELPSDAPHAVDMALAASPKPLPGCFTRLSIDRDLQRAVSGLLHSHQARLAARGASQAAVVVLDNAGGDILALAGSFAHEARDQGYVNGALAQRSSGSTLKPFLYALALDLGIPASAMIEDTRRTYAAPGGSLNPANFDRSAHGPVSLREALGNSLNLAAVRLAALIGIEEFFETLTRLGLTGTDGFGPEHYGLGLAVGNLEVSPLSLAAAYAALANGGLYRPPRLFAGDPVAPGIRVFSPQAAYVVCDFLSDPLARSRSFAGSAAMNPDRRLTIKTGTSTRSRDAWAAAVSAAHTVVVWTGNFSGEPAPGQTGAQAAAPVLAGVLEILYAREEPPRLRRPIGLTAMTVCDFSGLRAGPDCPHRRQEFLIAGGPPIETCQGHAPDDPWRRLPTAYAGWLFERHQRDLAGRFRLEGFDAALDRVFASGDQGDRGDRDAPAAPDGGRGVVGIVSPPPGTAYLLGPRQESLTVKVQAESSRPLQNLTFYVDGLEAARAGPPYEAALDLGRGRHTVTVATASGQAESIEIAVH